MSAERFFCALESRRNAESIYGTVARIDSWLLLEYPMAWRADAIPQSRLPEPLKQRLARLQHSTPLHRQVLIRQCYKPRESIRCFHVRSSENDATMSDVQFVDYDAVAATDLAAAFAIARPVPGPVYAVCTHGTHDKCCAKFGLQVYRALLREEGDAVWQCSHIGGDRFAGNVVVFPYGIYYGRVTPHDIPALVHHTRRGEILLSHYRGRCCYPRIVQVADFYVRSESARIAINEWNSVDVNRISRELSIVRFQSAHDGSTHCSEVRTIPDALAARLTCNSEPASRITQYELMRYWSE